MRSKNTFENKIELLNKFRPRNSILGQPSISELRNAAIFVTDTLDLCFASAEAVFEKERTPEIALAIYDRVVARMKDAKKMPNSDEESEEDYNV